MSFRKALRILSIFLFLLHILPPLLIAQEVIEEWVATYNGSGGTGDAAECIALDLAGNVFVTGYCSRYGTWVDYLDCVTLKYSSNGELRWEAVYNGIADEDDWPHDMAIDDQANVYVTGHSYNVPNSRDYFTIKYDSSGTEVWLATYDGPAGASDQANAVAIDDHGNVYVTGYSKGIGTENDYATIKYNSAGLMLWIARYDGPAHYFDKATDLAVDDEGNVYVTGWSHGIDSDYDYATLKYDLDGDELWVARYDAAGEYDQAEAIAIDSSGFIYVTGYSYLNDNPPNIDYTTIKYSPDGEQIWVAHYGGIALSHDKAYAICLGPNESIYVVGESVGYITNNDIALVKYDNRGEEQWVARYNYCDMSMEYPHSMTLDIQGNIYITGRILTELNDQMCTTLKYLPDGSLEWEQLYMGSFIEDWGDDIAVDAEENIYITGGTYALTGHFDYLTIKYSQLLIERDDLSAASSISFRLHPPHPNPFNFTTTIQFSLPVAGPVNLSVYDISGTRIATLAEGFRQAGEHKVAFDGSNLASGIYIYRLRAGEFVASGKMVLLK